LFKIETISDAQKSKMEVDEASNTMNDGDEVELVEESTTSNNIKLK